MATYLPKILQEIFLTSPDHQSFAFLLFVLYKKDCEIKRQTAVVWACEMCLEERFVRSGGTAATRKLRGECPRVWGGEPTGSKTQKLPHANDFQI